MSSAGTHGFDAEPASDTMEAEFARHGTDHTAFRSRPVTGDLVDDAVSGDEAGARLDPQEHARMAERGRNITRTIAGDLYG